MVRLVCYMSVALFKSIMKWNTTYIVGLLKHVWLLDGGHFMLELGRTGGNAETKRFRIIYMLLWGRYFVKSSGAL